MTRPRPPRRGTPPVVTPNPPAPNTGGLGALAAILTMPAGEVLAGARRSAASRRLASWELSLYLVRIDTGRLFAPAYRSTTAYGVRELGMRSSSVSKHLQAGRLLLTLSPERQRAVMEVGATTAYETGLLWLAERSPARAAALAKTAPTQRALRASVARLAGKPGPGTPLQLDAIAAGPDGLRWTLVVVAGNPPAFRLEITGREGRMGRPATRDRRQDLDVAGVAEELLRLAEAIDVRPALEALLRRRRAA